MHQFTLYAGIIITTLLLNTIAFVISILLFYSLPVSVTSTVTAYAAILIALTLLAWLIFLGGGAAILHMEREGHAPMALKLGIMLTTLIIYTVAFIISCILLSVLQNDIQSSLITARNYTASFLAINFTAWTILLAGSALLGKGHTPESEVPKIDLRENVLRRNIYSQEFPASPSRPRGYAYGMTQGSPRRYSRLSALY